MPGRLLRDWTASERMNQLSELSEIFFVRLIMKADDYGCYYANTRLLLANLFPLKPDITPADIEQCMREVIDAGLIILYEADDKTLLQIKKFGQRLRQKRKRFPQPTHTKSTKKDVNNMTATGAHDADMLLTYGGHIDDIPRPEEERGNGSEFEYESEIENEIEREGNANDSHTRDEFYEQRKNKNPILVIDELFKQALRDPIWMKAVDADERQLQAFNMILLQRHKTETTAADYRSHFAAMKAKFPERFRIKKTIEQLLAEARAYDEQHKNENHE